jgi:RHS repeat-associated protein
MENFADKKFLRDGDYATDPVLSDGSATFTPGISERRGSTTTFCHSGLKNASFQSGSSQTVSAERTYDAFGLVTSSTGTWQGPFDYAGGFGYQEDASGLKLLGHRNYDSSTGRFLTRDPIKDGRNWYVYCDSDTINYVDADGLDRIHVHTNQGGGGVGSHIVIGIEAGYSGQVIWYGFYPRPPETSGNGGSSGSSGSTSGTSKGGGRGRGHIQVRDKPKDGGESRIIEVEPFKRRSIWKRILSDKTDYDRGRGRPYDLARFNCATWILNLLSDPGVGIIEPQPSGRIWTPRRVLELIPQ